MDYSIEALYDAGHRNDQGGGEISRYGKDVVSVTELRKMLDKEMGQKKLTEELYAFRDGSWL